MPHTFPRTWYPARTVGQVGNLRRVGNPPESLVNRPTSAGYQPARRIPSCPTIHAWCPVSQKVCGIGQECLRHMARAANVKLFLRGA